MAVCQQVDRAFLLHVFFGVGGRLKADGGTRHHSWQCCFVDGPPYASANTALGGMSRCLRAFFIPAVWRGFCPSTESFPVWSASKTHCFRFLAEMYRGPCALKWIWDPQTWFPFKRTPKKGTLKTQHAHISLAISQQSQAEPGLRSPCQNGPLLPFDPIVDCDRAPDSPSSERESPPIGPKSRFKIRGAAKTTPVGQSKDISCTS